MLTARERECLQLICRAMDRDGVAPSYRELMAGLGVKNTSGVHRLLTGLESKGYVRRLKGRPRAIEVLKRPEGVSALSCAEAHENGRLAMAEKLIAAFVAATDPVRRPGMARVQDSEFAPETAPGMTLRDVRTAAKVFCRLDPVSAATGAVALARVKRQGREVRS